MEKSPRICPLLFCMCQTWTDTIQNSTQTTLIKTTAVQDVSYSRPPIRPVWTSSGLYSTYVLPKTNYWVNIFKTLSEVLKIQLKPDPGFGFVWGESGHNSFVK